MIKQYSWEEDNFGMQVTLAVDTDIFTKEMAMEHINFFLNNFDNSHETAIDYAIRSHAKACLYSAIQGDYNAFGVMDDMSNQEGYFPVDGSKGIVLVSVGKFELDLEDSFVFTHETKELYEMPYAQKPQW